MVIYDREKNVCGIYEIKHSDKSDANQYRHLADADKCEQTERRFGQIVSKAVLYRGESFEAENGIAGRFTLPGFSVGKEELRLKVSKTLINTNIKLNIFKQEKALVRFISHQASNPDRQCRSGISKQVLLKMCWCGFV